MKVSTKISECRIACKKKFNPESTDYLLIDTIKTTVTNQSQNPHFSQFEYLEPTSPKKHMKNTKIFERFDKPRSLGLGCKLNLVNHSLWENLVNETKSVLTKYSRACPKEEQTHTNKIDRFKLMSLQVRKPKRENIEHNRVCLELGVMKITKESIHNFDKQSENFSSKIKERSRFFQSEFKKSGQNKKMLHMTQSFSLSRPKEYPALNKISMCRPWSSKNHQEEEHHDLLFL